MSKSIRDALKGKTTKLKNLSLGKKKETPGFVDDFHDGQFLNIPIEQIHPDPDQPRKIFDKDKLKELSKSIKQNGVLQPVIVRKADNSTIFLVAGERRYKAAKLAGLESLPAMFSTGNPREIALIENLQREDLKPIEEAEALNLMIKNHGYTQNKLSKALGKSESTISEVLSLNKLPDEIRDNARDTDLSKSVLLEISKQKTAKAMKKLFDSVKDIKVTTRQIRKRTRKTTKASQASPINQAIKKIQAVNRAIPKLDKESLEPDEIENLSQEIQILVDILKKFGALG